MHFKRVTPSFCLAWAHRLLIQVICGIRELRETESEHARGLERPGPAGLLSKGGQAHRCPQGLPRPLQSDQGGSMTHITLLPGDDYTTIGVDVVAAQSLTRRSSMGVLTRRNVLLGTIVSLTFAAVGTTAVATAGDIPKVVAQVRAIRYNPDPNAPLIDVAVSVLGKGNLFETAVPLNSTNPRQIVQDIIARVLEVGKALPGGTGIPQDVQERDVVVFGGPL